MTPADEATFIALWTEGLTTAAIAQQLGIPVGTVKSRAHTLAHAGKLTPRPRGGVRQQGKAQPEAEDRPSTVHPLQADLTAALSAALQPVLARLEALENGLARRPPDDRPPSTVAPDTWELKQLKHSIRWTIYVPQAMKEALQRRAAATGQNPSLLVQEALARWLAEEV
jgi:hypothetical protein